MSKDIKALLAQKLAENNERHQHAKQEVGLNLGNELKRLTIQKIRPNPYQPRTVFDEKEIAELSQSIQEMGLLQPISVREIGEPNNDFQYEIIAGERRFRAMQLLKKTHIDAIVIQKSDADIAILALAENLQRQDLCDYEIGQALRQIENLFPNKSKLAAAIGINRQDMYRYFAYEALPSQFLEQLKTNPKLISRAAAEQIKKVLTKYNIDDDSANEILTEVWGKLSSGALEQSKIAHYIEQAVQPQRFIESQTHIKPFFVDGQQVGQIQHKAKKLVIELDSAFLNENDEVLLQNLIDEWLARKNQG